MVLLGSRSIGFSIFRIYNLGVKNVAKCHLFASLFLSLVNL